MRRGDQVGVIVFFTKCQPAAHGSCRSNLDYKVLSPDGSVYGEQRGVRLWNGPPAPGDNLQIATDRLQIRIEPKDLSGAFLQHLDDPSGIAMHIPFQRRDTDEGASADSWRGNTLGCMAGWRDDDRRSRAIHFLVPLRRNGDDVAVLVTRTDVGKHDCWELPGAVDPLAATADDTLGFQILQEVLQPAAILSAHIEGTSDLALADL